jgi:hypothetical protein
MRLIANSVYSAGSDGSEYMAVGLIVPLGRFGVANPVNKAAYVDPPSCGPIFQLPLAASSPVAKDFACRVADPASGAGLLMAGSIYSPENANTLASCLPAIRLGARWDDLEPPACALPRISADTTVLRFLADSAVLSSLRSAGVTCKVVTALINAKFSCFSIAAAGAQPPLSTKGHGTLPLTHVENEFCTLTVPQNTDKSSRSHPASSPNLGGKHVRTLDIYKAINRCLLECCWTIERILHTRA